MTLEAPDWRWASFKLREDRFNWLHIASDDRIAAGVVRSSRAANSRLGGRRVVGGHDLNTLLVRADLVGSTAALAPPRGDDGAAEPVSGTIV